MTIIDSVCGFCPSKEHSYPAGVDSFRFRNDNQGLGHLDPCEHQKVIGDDGTPYIPFESLPS